MNIAIRTDASLDIGTGHVMRCLTLAHTLKKKGNKVSFICREHQGHFMDRIDNSGFDVYSLPAPKMSSTQDISSASWLGAIWQEDADQTRIVIQKIGEPDWFIVDHYCLDSRWENKLIPHVVRIMVIDDLANRNHNCQLLLDQNYVQNMENRYKGKVSEKCRLLIGPKYALLNPIYAKLHESVRPRSGHVRRLLIFLGGSDKDNLTGKSLQAFLNLNRNDINVDVVVGRNNSRLESIKILTQGHSNIFLYHDLPSLAKIMVQADLAIGASGSTTWERLCLGLPSLVVSFGEDQRPIARWLHEKSYIIWIGHQDAIDVQHIEKVLENEIMHYRDERWSKKCLALVDGCGAERVALNLNTLQ